MSRDRRDHWRRIGCLPVIVLALVATITFGAIDREATSKAVCRLNHEAAMRTYRERVELLEEDQRSILAELHRGPVAAWTWLDEYGDLRQESLEILRQAGFIQCRYDCWELVK